MLRTPFCKRMGRAHSHVPPSQVRTRNLSSNIKRIFFSRLRYYGPQVVASPRSRLNSHDPGCRCLAASDNSLGVVHTVLRQESMATAFRSAFWGFSWPVPCQKKKAKDHRGPGPNEPTPRPVAMSSPGLTQQRSDDVCGSYVDGAGGSWLSFLASKFCYSCLFLSSGFIRSGSIPPGVLFSFPSSFSNLAFALSSLGFLLLLFLSFLKLSGSHGPRPVDGPCPSGSLDCGSHSSYSSVGGGVAVRRSGSAGV